MVDVRGRIDLTRPNAARMYDYYLGGSANLAVDQQAADKAIAMIPQIVDGSRANRAFLRRAVRYFLDQGVRQFLDLGSGIPTAGHVHEIAHAADPTSRVAYVDMEPVAVAHTRRLLAGTANVGVAQADLRDPESVLAAPEVAELIDPSRPVAVLLIAVLHFVSDSDGPRELVRAYRRRFASGSYLALSHLTDHFDTPARMAEVAELYSRSSHPEFPRSWEQFTDLLDGCPPVPPGVVYTPQWRPDPGDPAWQRPELSGHFAAAVPARP